MKNEINGYFFHFSLGKWWAPAQWFISLIIRARRAGRIKHDYLMDKIIDELHVYRTCCGMMFAYDWISIPLGKF